MDEKKCKKILSYVRIGEHIFEFDNPLVAGSFAAMARVASEEVNLEILVRFTEQQEPSKCRCKEA